MGRIADSLRANLREVAKSDARSLKEMDEELRTATQLSGVPQLKQSKKVKALLGQASWDQTNKTLQDLCRKNGIKKFSGLNKCLYSEFCIVVMTRGSRSNSRARGM